MRNRFILFISIVLVVSQPVGGVLYAGEQDLTGLDPSTVAGAEAVPGVVPQWSSSLEGIKSSTDTLLATNNKLGEEYRALSREVDKLTGELLRQQQTNKMHEETIRQKSAAMDLSAQAEDTKAEIAKTEKEIAEVKASLAELKARQYNVERRISLRRLKLKELELGRQAVGALGQQDNRRLSLSSLEDDVKRLRDEVANQQKEEKYLQERIQSLNQKTDPETAQQKQLFEENRLLRTELAKLDEESKALEVLARGEFPPGTEPSVQANFQKYQQMQASQRSAKEDIAKVTARKEQLAARLLAAGETDRGLDEKIKALQDQNRLIEVEVENLRENIAVLDYKINTLERYRDRNKAN